MIVVSMATAMLLLDVTIVYVALPEIQRDLHAGFTEMQWVIDAYTVALAATLLGAGALADRSDVAPSSPPGWPSSRCARRFVAWPTRRSCSTSRAARKA